MTETTLSDIYQDILETKINPRFVFELLVLMDLARNRVSVIRYWIGSINHIGDKIFTFDDGISRNLKRRFWKLSTEEKLVLTRTIKLKRANLLKKTNLNNLFTSATKYCSDYEQCLDSMFRAIKNQDDKMSDEYLKKATQIGGCLDKLFHTAERTQRKFVGILYETINKQR